MHNFPFSRSAATDLNPSGGATAPVADNNGGDLRKTYAAEGGYSVVIWECGTRGHFERNGEAIGGLWFDSAKDLIDYDGVFYLPLHVATALKTNGYTVGDDCI
jgi:hypothetical protein